MPTWISQRPRDQTWDHRVGQREVPDPDGADGPLAGSRTEDPQRAHRLHRLDPGQGRIESSPEVHKVLDVEIHQGLRVRAAPERVTDDIGLLNWEASP